MAQIIKKFIGDDQVGAVQILLENNQYLTALSDISATLNLLRVNTSNELVIGSGIDTKIENAANTSVNVQNNYVGVFSLDDPGSLFELNVHAIDVYGGGTNAPILKLFDADGSDSIGLRSAATSASYTLTLPGTAPALNQILKSDASGNFSWSEDSGGAFEKETFTLLAGDITNGYIDLANVADVDSIDFVISGLVSTEGVDYTVNYTGGAGGNTRITFSGHTPTLAADDVVTVKYQY